MTVSPWAARSDACLSALTITVISRHPPGAYGDSSVQGVGWGLFVGFSWLSALRAIFDQRAGEDGQRWQPMRSGTASGF